MCGVSNTHPSPESKEGSCGSFPILGVVPYHLGPTVVSFYATGGGTAPQEPILPAFSWSEVPSQAYPGTFPQSLLSRGAPPSRVQVEISRRYSRSPRRGRQRQETSGVAELTSKMSQFMEVMMGQQSLLMTLANVVPRAPELPTGPVTGQPVVPPPVPHGQPQEVWDVDAVSRDASDAEPLFEEGTEPEVTSQHSEQDDPEVLDTNDPMWSVVERAARHLGVDWPASEPTRRSLFELPSAQPLQSRMLPAFPDFIKEVQSTWGAPASTPATSRKAAAFNMHGASEAGLALFPPVGAAFSRSPSSRGARPRRESRSRSRSPRRRRYSRSPRRGRRHQETSGVAELTSKMSQFMEVMMGQQSLLMTLANVVPRAPELPTGPVAGQPVVPPPVPHGQPQEVWDVDAVSRDASDAEPLFEEGTEPEVTSQHSEQDDPEVLDTNDPMWSVVERAARHLGVDWPASEPTRRSLFELPSAHTLQSRILPAFPDFIKEVQSTWGAPASTPATSRKAAAFNMHGASEAGLASFPPVGAAFAALVKAPTLSGLAKDPSCPNRQCRITEAHLKKGYAAATEAVRLSNVASLLTVYQAALLRDLPECPSAALRTELGTVAQLLVKLAQLNARAQGRSIASLVVARRQLWLSQARVQEPDKVPLLDAPISPGHTFGPAVEEMLQRSVKAREASQQLAKMWPSKPFQPRRPQERQWRRAPPQQQAQSRGSMTAPSGVSARGQPAFTDIVFMKRSANALPDESADISCTEQVSLILRYVDQSPSGQFSVREDFVAFISTSDTTGETLTTLFLNHLQQSNLNPSNLVGQGYDGAGNMSGKIRGVQARIREKYPSAAYVHCRKHSLNLAITHSTRIPLVRNPLNTVQEIVAFVTASPKRMQCFLDKSDTKQRLQKFSDTRWSQHDACLSTVIMNYENVFATIDHLKTDTDHKCSDTAVSIAKAMESFEFLVCIIVCQGLLQYLTPLSNALRNPSCDLVKDSQQASNLVSLLGDKRVASTYTNLWENACALAEKMEIIVSLSRIARLQTQRSNVPAVMPQEYWCLNLFLPFLDHLTTQLDDRVCSSLPRLKAQYLLPNKLPMLTQAMWSEIKEEYEAMMSSVQTADAEHELWRHCNTDKSSSEICEILEDTVILYPNIHNILKELLTMPLSTASAERSFSCLRRLKTYLRSTISETRLTGLALMNMHHDVAIDSEKVLRDFDATGTRRIPLLFQD
ncbi:UNVERIFIED_CONTAM: hypothetical protein FKN15_066837 [Acipenser sinensis]